MVVKVSDLNPDDVGMENTGHNGVARRRELPKERLAK